MFIHSFLQVAVQTQPEFHPEVSNHVYTRKHEQEKVYGLSATVTREREMLPWFKAQSH